MNFGGIVVTLRKEQGTSQADLADKLIMHQNVYSRYELNEVEKLENLELFEKVMIKLS